MGLLVGVKFDKIGDWSANQDPNAVHHLAATWDKGSIKLYFDGALVGSGQSERTELKFALGDLRFGEDYPPTMLTNEPFQGIADDILVLRRALSAEEVKRLAETGATQVVNQKSDAGLLLTMDSPDSTYVDSLPKDGVQLVTGPGNSQPGEVELRINFATSAAGSIRCEIQDENGNPIPGYTFDDCDELYGDSLDHPVRWNGASELKPLVGKPIHLHFELKDADLFSLRFGR